MIVAYIGLVIIVAMLYQHWAIQHRKKADDNWDSTLIYYRRTMRWTVALSFIFFFGCFLLLSMDLIWQDDPNFLRQVQDFVQGKQPVFALLVAFFAAFSRVIAERSLNSDESAFTNMREMFRSFFRYQGLMKESTVGRLSNATLGQQRDAWFLWLCFSLALSVVQVAIEASLTNSSAADNASASGNTNGSTEIYWYLIGVALSIYIALGYFLWIYMVLFLKLVQVHNLSNRAARLFLGGLLHGHLPRQCAVIGPPLAGKSKFCQQSESLDVRGDTETTTQIDIRVGAVLNSERVLVQITTLDTPGENMGDHILLASVFRSDVLVFVLQLDMLDMNALRKRDNFILENWHQMVSDSGEQALIATKRYMQGFHLATKRSEKELLIGAKELFRVRALTLFLNIRDSSLLEKAQPILEENVDHWQRLAQDIGQRFGVDEKSCCCICGNAAQAPQGYELLTESTEKRLQKSVWPGRSLDAEGSVADRGDHADL